MNGFSKMVTLPIRLLGGNRTLLLYATGLIANATIKNTRKNEALSVVLLPAPLSIYSLPVASDQFFIESTISENALTSSKLE